MKKSLSIFLALLLLLLLPVSLTACLSEGSEQDGGEPAESSALPDTVKDEIFDAFARLNPSLDRSTFSVKEYYGKYGDAYACKIDASGLSYTEALRYVTVGSRRFGMNNGQRVYLFEGGTLYTLEEANTAGIMTDAEWDAFHTAYNALYPFEEMFPYI